MAKLSEERAVSVGYWTVSLPTWLIMMLFMWPPILLQGFEIAFDPSRGLGVTTTGVLAAIAAAGLWWSVATPRWRLWAYRRVAHLERLKALGVQDKLIWPDGSLFTRTEIRPRWLADELADLERLHVEGTAQREGAP